MKALTTVDHRKAQFLKYWLQFTSAVFLLEIVRSFVVWYSIKYQDPRWFRVDLFAAYAAQWRFKDPYIAICCGFLFLFGLGNNQLFHRCISHPTICDIFNELLVVNTHDFLQSNQPGVHLVLGSLKDGVKSPWKTILQLGRIYRHLWRFGAFPNTGRQNRAKGKVKFNEKMNHFKFLSVDDRIRIFMVNIAFEVPCKLVSLALGKLPFYVFWDPSNGYFGFLYSSG